jgi:sigma54-dependent transcription regulator
MSTTGYAYARILNRQDILLNTPTGSGKTETEDRTLEMRKLALHFSYEVWLNKKPLQ